MNARHTTDAELMHELATAQAWPARKPRAGIKPPPPIRLDAKVFEWASRLDASAPRSPAWNRVFTEAKVTGRLSDLFALRRAMWGRT